MQLLNGASLSTGMTQEETKKFAQQNGVPLPDAKGGATLDATLWFPSGVAIVQRKTPDGLGKEQAFCLAPVPDVALAEDNIVQIVDQLTTRRFERMRVTDKVPDPGRQPSLHVRDLILRVRVLWRENSSG